MGEPLVVDGHVVFDHVVLVCNGCGGERTFYPDAPLVGAEALVEWMKTRAMRCACGASTCDVKAHMKEARSDG